MALMSTSVCVPRDTQVCFAMYTCKLKLDIYCSVTSVDLDAEINTVIMCVLLIQIFSLNHSLIGTKCEVEINECLSNPCMSGGTCMDNINGFQCLCPPSTHGPLCLSGTDHCAHSPCVHGDCIEQQHGYDAINCYSEVLCPEFHLSSSNTVLENGLTYTTHIIMFF